MTILTTMPAAAVATAILALAAVPTEAATARQYTFQGQGLYMTSAGVPENFVASYASPQPAGNGTSSAKQIRDFEHHGRYFGGDN